MPTPAVVVAPLPAIVPSAVIVELRQYTLKPGQREALIELFDREFLETQEAVGMTVIGQFRDLDRPDHFVWLRGFPDLPSRATSLAAFYDGPVWRAHGESANRTMIDSDNVLLLEPASPRLRFAPADRLAPAATPAGTGLIVATIYYPRPEAMDGFRALFAETLRPLVTAAGAAIVAEYATSASPNNFPRLPVREGETAYVWFARFDSAAAYQRYREKLAADSEWSDRVAPAAAAQFAKPAKSLRLRPTSRSRLRG